MFFLVHFDKSTMLKLLITISVCLLVFIYSTIQTGCNFTKCCREKCTKMGITGWVKNSKSGTILGKMQGTKQNVEIM